MPLVVAPKLSVSTASTASTTPSADPNTQSYTSGYNDVHTARTTSMLPPINLNPPNVPKLPTITPKYQTRWEREKAKARAEGNDIEGGGPKMIGPWVMGEMLGRGASGRVRLARHFSTGKLAAVKILNLHPTLSSRSSTLASAGEKAEKMMLTAEREIAVMKLLDHPNIMKMYDVWSSAKELYLVLEYVQGGELFDYLCGRGTRLPLLEAISIIKQVLAGVDYCHRFSICHRDLKPENILLTTETVELSSGKRTEVKHVKIADFGMSTLDSLNGMLRTSCGSPHYAAPEIVRGQTYSGATSDIWSCGVIFFALLTSRLPFDDPNINNVLRKVRDGRFSVPDYVVEPAKDLLVRMLEVDIEKRISMSEIFRHPLLHMNTPGIILPPAPKIDDIALPVVAEEVDPDLLRNLCIIWRENDRGSMVNRLCCEEKNFEKAFYFLLCRYRDRSFEEYNMDPMGISSLSTPQTPAQLPTSSATDIPADIVDSPIRRHYPGRVSPHILAATRKTPLTRQLSGVNLDSPSKRRTSVDKRDSVTRRSSVSKKSSGTDRRGSISSCKVSPIKSKATQMSNSKPESPRRSRILSETSATANGSPLNSRISSHKSISTSGDNRKRSGSASSKSSVRRASKPDSTGSLPSNAAPIRRSSIPTSVRNGSEPQKSATFINATTHNRMAKSQPSKNTTIHRRATSASGAIPSSWSSGKREKDKGQRQPTIQEDKAANPLIHSSAKTTDTSVSATPVPRGIVSQRKSLLTAQIRSSEQVSRKESLRSTPTSATAGVAVSTAIQDKSEEKLRTLAAQRLTSPSPQSSPRPLSKVISPARYGPPSAGTNAKGYNLRSPYAIPINNSPVPLRESNPGSSEASSSTASHLQPDLTPTKKATLSSILETDNMHFSDPVDLKGHGLGVFLSPISKKSPSTTPVSRTERRNAVPSQTDPASSKNFKFSPAKTENDAENALKSYRWHSDADPVDRKLSFVASGTNGSSKSSEAKSSGSGSSEDTWEKLDVQPDSSNSGDMDTGEGGKNKKLKRRPAPLDLLNPHVSNRRLQPRPNAIDIPKPIQSPLLSPFLGFWGGNSTPVTPSLVGTLATPSTASSQMLGYANSGGGRGLFAKLFDWKSPNLCLMSSEPASTTREECARILREMNVTFAPSDSGGFKCRADDVVDPQGNRVNKAVRFRIEIHQLTPSLPSMSYLTNSFSSKSYNEHTSTPYSQRNNQIAAGTSPRPASIMGPDQYPRGKKPVEINGSNNSEGSNVSTLIFVQEKGAYSVLRTIHQLMKNRWKLDAPGMVEGVQTAVI